MLKVLAWCFASLLLSILVLAQQEARRELLGGQATIFDTTPNAFGQPIPGLEREQELLFFVGNSFFNQNWVSAPASTKARDGLGPLFNAHSCAGCHFKDGRGRPPEFDGESPTGLLVRIGLPQRDHLGGRLPEPTYGLQFQNHSIDGVEKEGDLHITYEEITGSYPDGNSYSLRKPTLHLEHLRYGPINAETVMSARVANQMIGLGLLEAISEEDILANADPDDHNQDGISGKPNWVTQDALGRFGWKAEQPSIAAQVAAAFSGDLGITSKLQLQDHCTDSQIECKTATTGINSEDQAEIADDDFDKVVLYSSSLAVPAQRNSEDPQVLLGEGYFKEANCSGCHIESFTTQEHPTIPALSFQHIRPYTDLLLHDMGPGLADNLSDFEATGAEWRTPPLWGIGLFETVNKHSYYLHDGRARNLEEAILWHSGEAEDSKQLFMNFTREQRQALIIFLRSL